MDGYGIEKSSVSRQFVAASSNQLRAAATGGPFKDFYESCIARGVKPHLARLTLARKIAAITLHVWKKGASFDAEHLKQQAA